MTGPALKISGGSGLSRVFVLSVLMISFSGGSAAPAAEPVSFSRDIRPLLSDRCFACHGPDRKRRKKKLGPSPNKKNRDAQNDPKTWNS